MTPNPFTLVYDALWALPGRHPTLSESGLLRAGNKILFDKRDPIKQSVAATDLPELILTSDGLLANMQNTSSSSMVTRQYTWMISTGDFRIKDLLYQVEWALLCAMTDWKRVVSALTYQDSHFVKRCAITGASEGQSDPERNRGIKGWSALWRHEVEMHFSTQMLIDELTEATSSSGI